MTFENMKNLNIVFEEEKDEIAEQESSFKKTCTNRVSHNDDLPILSSVSKNTEFE